MSLPAPTAPLKSLLLIIGASLLLAALAACASPTPTPTATPTPTPTATPTPAPTPTPTPDAMTLSPDDGGIAARDLLAMLTADEEACVRAAVGDAAYDQLLNSPASAVGGPEFPFDCISDERFAEISVASLSQIVGGLSSESESCLRALYAGAGGASQQFPVGLSSDPESIAFAIRFILCVTDDEAEAFANQPGGAAGGVSDFFTPSDLRCIADEVGEDEFIDVFVGLMEGLMSGQAQPSPDLMRGLTQVAAASQACGIDPLQGLGGAGGGALPQGVSPFGAESGDRGSFAQVKAIWLELDGPDRQPLIDCLEAAASEEELDLAFVTGAFPPAVAACMERHADLVPQFTPDSASAAGQ